MTVSTQRAVDRWAGVPACVALTLYRRVFRRPRPSSTIRRILFVKLAEQGSTVLAADALRHAIEQVGREHVFFLTFEENRFILDAMAMIPAQNILTLDVRSLVAAVRSLIVVVHRLRARRIDAAVDLEFFARSSAILTFLSGAGARVGMHSFAGEGPYRGDLMTHRVVCNPYLHVSDMFLMMVQALAHPPERFPAFAAVSPNTPPAQCPSAYQPSAGDVEAMQRLLHDCTRSEQVPPVILLNANSGDLVPLRRWDAARYVELARRLLAALPEIRVVLTGGPGEVRETERLAGEIGSPRCGSVAGKTTLRQLLALYSLSRVLVTNDSGAAHFATLTGIEVVTLFGPETPALFAARTPRNRVLWSGIVCSPCVNAFNNRLSRCRDNLCMQRITVEDVFEATMGAYMGRDGA